MTIYAGTAASVPGQVELSQPSPWWLWLVCDVARGHDPGSTINSDVCQSCQNPTWVLSLCILAISGILTAVFSWDTSQRLTTCSVWVILLRIVSHGKLNDAKLWKIWHLYMTLLRNITYLFINLQRVVINDIYLTVYFCYSVVVNKENVVPNRGDIKAISCTSVSRSFQRDTGLSPR